MPIVNTCSDRSRLSFVKINPRIVLIGHGHCYQDFLLFLTFSLIFKILRLLETKATISYLIRISLLFFFCLNLNCKLLCNRNHLQKSRKIQVGRDCGDLPAPQTMLSHEDSPSCSGLYLARKRKHNNGNCTTALGSLTVLMGKSFPFCSA